MKPYSASIEQLTKHYQTDIKKGLSENMAKEHLEKLGSNILPRQPKESIIKIFIRQFQSPLIYLLLIAAIIIFALGEHMDAFILSGILLFNSIIGTIQEGRTANIIESLQKLITQETIVIRDGQKEVVPSEQLVPGDIIILQEGNRVPADARIVQVHNLIVEEAVLTGESQGVNKIDEPINQEVQIADQKNMVFSGTYVLQGMATALVTATGSNTEIGKVQKSIEHISTETPLKETIEHLSRWIIYFIFGICSAMLIFGFLQGKPIVELMTMLAALFICVIPEGLPVVLTLVLVTGAYRMAKQHMLVKNLPAVEALGRVDVLVIDKTGTLTRNEMVVEQVFTDNTLYDVSGRGYFIEGQIIKDGQPITHAEQTEALKQMGTAAGLLNHSEIKYDQETKQFSVTGDPTEASTYIFSKKMGITKADLQHYKLIYEIPFSSDLGYHASFFEYNGKGIVYIIGAPELVINKSEKLSQSYNEILEQFLKRGLRILGVATKQFDLNELKGNSQEFFEKKIKNLNFLGFFAIQDAIRKDVETIVQQARNAGVHIILVTGDHERTAVYVAQETGIFRPGDHVIDGPQFRKTTDENLEREIEHVTVFSRVLPHEKMRIIKALHNRGFKVAMTGDGVNDAPALVAADVGIAMGGIGTEVAKEASDVILMDDSFKSIISGIGEGRHIFDTLRRTILYFFATNMGEVLIVLFALVANLPIPLLASQILWLNFITDGFLDTAISVEPQHKDVLTKEWLKKETHLINVRVLLKTLSLAIPMALGSLGIFIWYYQQNIILARTMTLITMAMFQWFNAWNCRSLEKTVWQIGLFKNKWLIAATIFVVVSTIGIVYIPWIQPIFRTVPLTLSQWLTMTIIASSVFFVEEFRKLMRQRKVTPN